MRHSIQLVLCSFLSVGATAIAARAQTTDSPDSINAAADSISTSSVTLAIGTGFGASRDDVISPLAAGVSGLAFAIAFERRGAGSTFGVKASAAFSDLSFGRTAFTGTGISGALSFDYLLATRLVQNERMVLWIGPKLLAFIDYEDATTRTYDPSWTLAVALSPEARLTYADSAKSVYASVSFPIVSYVVRPPYSVFHDAMLQDITSVFWTGTWHTIGSFPLLDVSAGIRLPLFGSTQIVIENCMQYYSASEPRNVKRLVNTITAGMEISL